VPAEHLETGIRGPARGCAPVPLSILDLANIGTGSTARDALLSTTALAVRAEQLGYQRFWVAEHHGIPAVAAASPAVLLAHIAAATSTIRLGSGGVMLPNHAPLAVAEQFGTLAALHPGRIDLGLGRAAGSDQLTAFALRRNTDQHPGADFAERLNELQHFLHRDFPEGHPFANILATPVEPVPVWLLGSSDYSAKLAARLGLPFAFAHHFTGSIATTTAALDIYRSNFTPSAALTKPYALIAVNVLAAHSVQEALYQARAGALSMLWLRSGTLRQVPTPQEAASFVYTQAQSDLLDAMQAAELIGTPSQVANGLRKLVERFNIDELMLTTRVHGPAARLQSFELIADAFGLGESPVTPTGEQFPLSPGDAKPASQADFSRGARFGARGTIVG